MSLNNHLGILGLLKLTVMY